MPGSTRYRLRVDATGFTNLYVVGDWMRNGLNIKSFEGCTMSAMMASRAISGYPREVTLLAEMFEGAEGFKRDAPM